MGGSPRARPKTQVSLIAEVYDRFDCHASRIPGFASCSPGLRASIVKLMIRMTRQEQTVLVAILLLLLTGLVVKVIRTTREAEDGGIRAQQH